jgi:hypothetical protein
MILKNRIFCLRLWFYWFHSRIVTFLHKHDLTEKNICSRNLFYNSYLQLILK